MKNYLRIQMLTIVLFAVGLSSLQAQYVVKETFYETTGVSNEGVVAGYEEWAGPYFLWDANANTYAPIGGAAPGNGVGGSAKFSADGNYISGSSYDVISLTPVWERNVLTDYSYIFKDIEFPAWQNQTGWAAGQSVTYNGHGIILRTDDGGYSWYSIWTDTENRGIESMSFPSTWTGYVCGWNGYFAKSDNEGWSWTTMTPGPPADVYIYTAVEFKDDWNGVVTAQTNDGAGVYITADGGSTWTTGSGLASVPYKITYVSGDTYFLVGNGGQIQKSVDNGLTWTTVHTAPVLLLGINFYDDMIGFATGETYVYKTVDGGATWTQHSIVPGLTDGALWRDIEFTDQDHIVLVGTPDLVFESANGGTSWTWANEAIFNGGPALYDIAKTDIDIHVCGSQGNFYKKSLITSVNIAEMSRYNVTSGEWTRLGSLGTILDASRSGGYNISGDGNTVIGNSWATQTPEGLPAHAVAWTEETGIIDLGTLFPGRSTRAEAASYDASIIVGWQDINGPWKSAVWRKNPAGGYFPNEYLLIDPNGNPNDEFNQLGEARAISSNGVWIGGRGDYANNEEPWIWSEATGYISLGTLGGTGSVAGINDDGTMVVGWFNAGPWDPQLPFIWTPNGGLQDLNVFITETLGYPMSAGPVYTANSMSPNGKYVAGFGYDPNIGPWGELFTYRLEIPGIPTNDNCDAAIALVCGESVSASTVFATNSGGNASNDVFYTYTGNGSLETIRLSTCNPATQIPTTVRVYTDCSLTTQIGYNDSSCDNQPFLDFQSDGTSTYYIMIEGYSASNAGFFELSTTCQTGVGIDDLALNETRIYPNPAKDKLNIASDVQIESIEMYSISGQLVISENIQSSNYIVDLTSIQSGVYFVKAITSNSAKTFKIVKE